jgi:uncharacterized membrane protein
VVVVGAPLVAFAPTLRLSVVVSLTLLIAALFARPWAWSDDQWRRILEYNPSPRAIRIGALVSGLLLFWIVFTLFKGGHINGVDFTVYFDRPFYQTTLGRPLYVETTDEPAYEYVTHLGVHGYWLMMPLALFYKVYPSPIWPLALSVVAVVAGAVYIVRIGRQGGFGGLMSCAAGFAFMLNDNTARTLRYGFHPEVLFAWCVPWMLDAGLRGRRDSYLAATLACVLVIEDAVFPVFAVTVALALARGRAMTAANRFFFLALPNVLALASLAVFFEYVVPALSPRGTIEYANFWTNYGPTPLKALIGMAMHPLSVVRDFFTSGMLRVVLPPFLLLPLIGWRWSIGILPLALVFGASANDQLRQYGIYYAIYLVPFLTLGGAAGALILARRFPRPPRAIPTAAFLVFLGALVIGRGYAIRPWRAEIAAVPDAVAQLAKEGPVLVQSGLYPHAGYDEHVRLLTPHGLRDPRNANAAILVAPAIDPYPFGRMDIDRLLRRPPIAALRDGLVAVRNEPGGALRERPGPGNP